MRLNNWAFAAALIAGGAEFALADTIDDCRQTRNPALRSQACTSIIADPDATTGSKAIAFRNRGVTRADAGANDAAVADFTGALALNPEDPTTLASRGHARLALGDTVGAIADFSAAIAIAPSNTGHLISRGHAYTITGDTGRAIADFDAALVLKPDSASALNHRGLAWRKQGEVDRAIADYTAAINLNPVYALAYNNRGYAYESKGESRLAKEDFVRALLLDASLAGASAGLKRLGGTGPLAAESDALIARGKDLVEANCSRCHATGTAGDSPNPKAPLFRAIHQRHKLLALREPLSRGIAATHDEMPSFKMTEAEIDAIIAYINALPDK